MREVSLIYSCWFVFGSFSYRTRHIGLPTPVEKRTDSSSVFGISNDIR